MKFTNKYTYSDLLELLWTRQRFFFSKSILFYLAGISMLCFPALFYKEIASAPGGLVDKLSFTVPIMVFGLGLFPPTNATLMAWLMLRNQRKMNPNGFDCEISTDSIDLFTHSGAHYLKWATFIKGRESKSGICLFTATEGFIFPKRYFNSETLAEFKTLISQKTAIQL